MRALLLAAGVGSRLKPYTDSLPKPMLSIGGQPILAYNLAMLARGGFDDVLINLHALPETIRAYVGDGARWDVRVKYSEESQLLGTAGALVPQLEAFGRETFAIVFGDNLNDLDLRAMLRFHRERNAATTVAIWERDDTAHSGVAELAADDRIERFIEKPPPGTSSSHWVNAGVVIAEPALLTYVPGDQPSDLGRDVLPAMIADDAPVYGYRIRGGHWWFDRTSEYENARSDVALRAFIERSRG